MLLSTNLLGGATNLTTDVNGNIIRDPSDERLKKNIVEIEDALDLVLQLRGVRYEWKDADRFGEQIEIGFIAQEVDGVLPEVVSKGGEYWSLNTKNMVAVVVEAVQELWQTVSGHEDRITELEKENTELRERLDEIESTLDGDDSYNVPDPVNDTESDPEVPDDVITEGTGEEGVEIVEDMNESTEPLTDASESSGEVSEVPPVTEEESNGEEEVIDTGASISPETM